MSNSNAAAPRERWEAEIDGIMSVIHESRGLINNLKDRLHFILRPDNVAKDVEGATPNVPGDVCPLLASLVATKIELDRLFVDLNILQSRIDD